MSSTCGYSILVHSSSKAGKSTLIETAPAPRLILDAEGSSVFLKSKKIEWDPNEPPPKADGSWDTCIVFVRDYKTMDKTYQWLASGLHPFKSIGIDSISEVQQRAVDTIAGTTQLKQNEWGVLFRELSSLARKFRDLLIHETNPVQVVAYSAMSKVNPNGKTVPFLQGQVANTMPYYVSVVGYLKVVETEEGIRQRMLLITEHELYEAGNRFEDTLPNVIANPNLTNILNQICEGA